MMKVKELIKQLKSQHPEAEVVISEADGDMTKYQKVAKLKAKSIVFCEDPFTGLGKVFWNGVEVGDREFPECARDEKLAEKFVVLDF
jgi:hypothetical protein